MSKNWTYSWRLCFLKKQPQFFHSESSAKIMCFTTGLVLKNHISQKLEKDSNCNIANYVPFFVPGLSTSSFLLLHLHLILEQYGRGPWRIGGDGRIGTPRQKAQRQGSVNAAKKWKLHHPNRRWNSQNFWKRSGSENIHTNPGQPKEQKRSTRKSSRKIRRVFFNLTTRIIMVWWWSQKLFLVSLKRFHLPSSRGTPSQTVRAEKNFPQIHWNALTSTLDVMSDKILTIAGMLMGIANCQIHGLVSQDSPYWATSQSDGFSWSREDWQKNDSRPDKLWTNVETYVRYTRNVMRTKVGHRETKARYSQQIMWYLLHWSWSRGISGNHEECS